MSLYSSIRNSVDLSEFIKDTNFYGEPINPLVQQDACEFLLSIFQQIELQENTEYKKHLFDIFGGVQLQEIRYHDPDGNENVSENEQNFYLLPVDIKGKKNLMEALNHFVKPVDLDGDNRYSFNYQGKQHKTKAIKRCMLKKMP